MENLSISKNGKKMGRPRTDAVPVMVRVYPRDLLELDQWRAMQPDDPSRPEAIRRLMALALEKNLQENR